MIEVGDMVRIHANLPEANLRYMVIRRNITSKFDGALCYEIVTKEKTVDGPAICNLMYKDFIDNLNKDLIRNKKINQITQ